MKVETIIGYNENVFSEVLTEFINQHKVDHVDTHVQFARSNLCYVAMVFYYEDTKLNLKDFGDVDLHNLSIDILNFPARAANFFKRRHILTVKGVLDYLCEDPNFEHSTTIGPHTKHEIVACLLNFGIDWQEYYKNYHLNK
jgi:hypothetical protein